MLPGYFLFVNNPGNEKQEEEELNRKKTTFSHRGFFPGYFSIIKKPCNSIWKRKYNTHYDFSWSKIEIKNKNGETAKKPQDAVYQKVIFKKLS